ncbi:MAG: alpha/beta fold hydrolase [Alphaproteobacteria bacterium]|nr:alpha/beta fold hydrolase [Alphaproteobacteria bacterium]
MAHFIVVDGNPVPDGASAHNLVAGDGAKLRIGAFPRDGARGTFLVLTGWSEFMEKYFETVRDLHARGFACMSMDWRGQGLSERFAKRGTTSHIEDFALFRADIDLMLKRMADDGMPRPFYALTHSMGGAPMLQRLADGRDDIRAAVLCAPLTRLKAGAAQTALARLGVGVATALGAARSSIPGWPDELEPFGENSLTSDPARHDLFVRLQKAEPNAQVRRPTFGWLKAAIAASDDLHRPDRFKAMSARALMISAGIDRLVDSDDHALLAASSERIERRLVAEARHEILIERDELRHEFWTHADAFIETVA